MVEIRLHGLLAKEFGMKWRLDIASALEAVDAIETTKAGFKRRIMELADKGMVFRLRTRTVDLDGDSLALRLGADNRLDIIPLIAGAGAGFRFVLGAAMIIGAAIVTGGMSAAMTAGSMSSMFVMGGASLMLGAVTQWLTPVPKMGEATKSAQSWTFSGPANTVDQGGPVPVIYGEVLTGAYPISAGIIAAQISLDQAAAPSVLIGGNTDFNSDVPTGQGIVTVRQRYSTSPLNMAEPFTYAWSQSGFPGVVATRLVNADKATVTLEIDINTSANPYLYSSGTISVTVHGKNSDGGDISASKTQTINMSASQPQEVRDGGA